MTKHFMTDNVVRWGVTSLALLPISPITFADGTDTFLEEVTVTARKREESLQDAPLAVSAFTGEALEYRGIVNLSQVAEITPNLTFQNNPSFGGASNAAAIYLRGVGQKEFLPTTDPGVGIYIDGVYVARSVGAILDLIDVEQVEVLRGPQGTLFGRNTIGGAISLTTRKPHETLSGSMDIKFGTDNRQDIKGTINLPLSDTLYSSLSLATFNQDGYLKREDGVELGDDETLTGRIALRWLASENLDINFTADYTEDKESGPAMTLIGIAPGTLPSATPAPPIATIYNVGATLRAGGPAVPCAVGGITTPGLPAVPDCYDNSFVQGNDYNAGTAPAFSESELWSTNLNIEWDLNESLTLKSITAFRSLDSQFARDGDHSPFTVSQFFDDLEQDQFSQEFQLLGDTFDGRLKWVLGAYYFEEDGNNVNLLDFAISNFRSGGKFDTESTALFAQGTWDINDKLSLTLGLRYTDETKSFLPDQIIFNNPFEGTGDPNLDAPFLAAGSRILPLLEKETDIQETNPMLNLAYQWNNSLMTYATYSEGFKSGGFTQRVFPPIVAPFTAPAGTPDIDLIPTFEPEFVKVYELGAKYRSNEGRLTVNAAIFQTTYDDMQIQVFTSVAPVTRNAGSATIEGAELEIQAIPGNGWLLDFSLGLLDASYDDIDTSETLVDKDNDFERVSDVTANGGVSKEFTLDSGSTITARVDVSYRSEMYHDTFNTEALKQDDLTLVNARISWLSADQAFSVNLSGTNLTDEEYLISGVQGDAFQSIEGLFHRGFEWQLAFKYEF